MQTILVQPQALEQPIQLFDGSRIFVHAPQFHWHAAATEGIPAVDQEARDHLVSIADLLDQFGRRTELQEEEVWARSEHTAEGSEVVRLVEPLKDKIMQLEERVVQLEQKVHEVETRSIINQSQRIRDREDVDRHFGQMQMNFANVNHRLDVVETITKNWDKMQQELTLMNTEVAAIRSTQTGLHSLMEGLAKQMENLTSGGTTQEETSADIGGGLGESQVQVPPSQMVLGTIPEEESA